MSEIKIYVVPAPQKEPEEEPPMYAGRFYVSKDSDQQLVFAASVSYPGDTPVRVDGGCEPDGDTPVVAIGGAFHGYSLKGLFMGVSEYEEVDVEITVKRRA